MNRTLAGTAAAFVLGLAALLPLAARTELPAADVRFVNGTEPKTLDPQLMTGQPEGRIAEAIFEGLTRHDPATLEPVPGVAERWEISPDGRRYTFHLRGDARWSDGRPVTAHDFAWSWRRLLAPETGGEYGYLLHSLHLAEAFASHAHHADALEQRLAPALVSLREAGGAGDPARVRAALVAHQAHDALRDAPPGPITELLRPAGPPPGAAAVDAFLAALPGEVARLRSSAAMARARFGVDAGAYAEGDHRFVVELDAETPYFLALTAFYPLFPSPRHLVERPGRRSDWFLPEHVVSNGPFRLERWRVGDRIRLVRSETYWGRDAVRARTIDALPVENATTALNLYLTGEVDWLPGNYPTDLGEALRVRPDFYSGAGMMVYFYRFNTRRPPFDDVRVREAINLAIDRRVIVEEVLGLGQLPAATFVPPGMAGYEAPESRIRLDPARARALLAEAGYPGGAGLPEIGILYNTSEAHRKVAEVVADQLRHHLGLRASAYNQEWQSFLETVRGGDYSMARAGWIGDYEDPNTFLDMWVTAGGNNQTGFSSADYDLLVRAARDPGAAAARPGELLAATRDRARIAATLDRVTTASTDDERRAARAHLRMELFREAESILVREAFPIAPLYFYTVSGLVAPGVRGLHTKLRRPDGSLGPNLQDLHPLREVWVDRGGSTPP